MICHIFKYVSQSNMFVVNYNLFENNITECSIRKVLNKINI